jgi:hypothetical protein
VNVSQDFVCGKNALDIEAMLFAPLLMFLFRSWSFFNFFFFCCYFVSRAFGVVSGHVKVVFVGSVELQA